MRHCHAIGLFIVFAASLSKSIADDAVAVLYATEAVDALRAELRNLNDTLNASSPQFQQLQSDLHNAELTLLQLRNDNAGIERLLKAEVNRQTTLLNAQQSLADRGYAGQQELSISELRVLIAQCNHARHTGDQMAVETAIRRAIEVEKSKLASILHQASRGYAGRESIAKQKLRIAQLIVTKTITLPPGS